MAFNRGTPKAPLCERGERRTSVKGSEIGADSDTCFLTPPRNDAASVPRGRRRGKMRSEGSRVAHVRSAPSVLLGGT